ncbi:TonB-dependent receptor [Geomonas sp. RF6]|uniref:TonB-dependent receptor plug domain-containing protein n=1 Tax=Geomonas sp. RF6 TaxID=2897342 RepID=UPI001E30750A|nr:TonB-dependent receptor [Geomonas sp. RF6]UFS69978.1 TonB-dependent receptor [Geomonas sp. RF6]
MDDVKTARFILRYKTGYRLMLLLLSIFLLPSISPAADPAADMEPRAPATESETPSRLAPLGLEKLMDLEVTTVTRTESTIGKSAAAVTVITQEDIRRSGATTIPELFRRVPGMDVARVDNNKWATSARGFNDRFSNKMLVQMDGRTIYDVLLAGVVWNSVDYPLEDIERIEVIRGPGASVWGANAVNGVINIITKSAKDTQGGLLSADGGVPEGVLGEVRYGGLIRDKGYYRIYAQGFDHYEQFAPQGDPNDGWWGADTGFRTDWQFGDSDLVTFQGDYVHSDAGRRDPFPLLSPPINTIIQDTFISDNSNILARWTRNTGEQANWTLQGYWWRFASAQPVTDINHQYDTYDLDFQHQFPFGEIQKVTYGLGYRFQSADVGNSLSDNGFVFSWNQNDFNLSLYSAFVQDEISLLPNTLSLILGSKFEHNDFTGFEIQPTARLLWTPAKQHSIWASVSRAVRTPSIVEEGVRLKTPPTTLPSGGALFPQATGNPDLESETLIAYELGYRTQLVESFSLDAALFYNDYEKLILGVPQTPQAGPTPGTQILPVLFENGMHGRTYGAEIAADWRPAKGLRLYGAYSWLRMDLHADEGLPASTAASAKVIEQRNPRQQVFLQASVDPLRNVEFDVMGRYVSKLQGFAQEVPAYYSMDARLAWRLRKNFEISVVGQNLLDNHHPEFGASSLLSTPVVEIRRNVYGKATWLF